MRSLLIADSHNHVLRRLDPATGLVSTVAGNGKIGWRDHGVSTQAGFNYPTGLAIDRGTSTIYVYNDFDIILGQISRAS